MFPCFLRKPSILPSAYKSYLCHFQILGIMFKTSRKQTLFMSLSGNNKCRFSRENLSQVNNFRGILRVDHDINTIGSVGRVWEFIKTFQCFDWRISVTIVILHGACFHTHILFVFILSRVSIMSLCAGLWRTHRFTFIRHVHLGSVTVSFLMLMGSFILLSQDNKARFLKITREINPFPRENDLCYAEMTAFKR